MSSSAAVSDPAASNTSSSSSPSYKHCIPSHHSFGISGVHHGTMDQEPPKSSYKTLGRWQTALIFITNEIGIGVLSLPKALHYLGVVPGIIAIIGIGLLVTYTSYILGQFYRRYPTVMNIVDCCQIMGGKPLAWICAVAFVLNLVMACAAAILTMSIALNTMSRHAMCTIWFIAFPAVVSWLLCIPRKLKFIAHIGIPNTISVVAALLILMISLAVAHRPNGALPGWEKEISIVGHPSFFDGLRACLVILFAYSGSQGFVTVMSEMEDAARDFTPALIMLQAFTIPVYTIVAAVVYALAGKYIRSPALGSAPTTPAIVAFGVFLPCLLATAIVFGHTTIKYLFVVGLRCLRAEDEYTQTTRRSWFLWIGIGTIVWISAFLLANAIPVFVGILTIMASIFVAWFTLGLSSVLWVYLNWGSQFNSKRKAALAVLNWTIIATTVFINIVGMWASMELLLKGFTSPTGLVHGPFTCADNSLF